MDWRINEILIVWSCNQKKKEKKRLRPMDKLENRLDVFVNHNISKHLEWQLV